MRRLPALFIPLMLSVVAAPGPSLGQDARLSGAWNGSGTITTPSGNTEKARCRATFQPAGSGATMSATCATASVRVQQQAELDRIAPGRYRGDFRNIEYGITGSIRISVSGNALTASLNGGGGSATFNLSR
jgi:hypothetical protein